MPYQSKVSINSNNFDDEISKFISPLKMFEYLATGIPIISSDLKVLREILINQKKFCAHKKLFKSIFLEKSNF